MIIGIYFISCGITTGPMATTDMKNSSIFWDRTYDSTKFQQEPQTYEYTQSKGKHGSNALSSIACMGSFNIETL